MLNVDAVSVNVDVVVDVVAVDVVTVAAAFTVEVRSNGLRSGSKIESLYFGGVRSVGRARSSDGASVVSLLADVLEDAAPVGIIFACVLLNEFKSTAATFRELFNALWMAAGGSFGVKFVLPSRTVDQGGCVLVHATETDCFTMGSLHMSVRSYT